MVSPLEEKTELRGGAGQLLAVFLCGTLAFLDLYCVQPLLPLLSRVMHASESAVGLTISAATLGVAVSAMLLAVFGERLDRKRTIVISMTALALSTLMTSTAHNLVQLAMWRLLEGLLTPGIFIITIAYVTEEWPALQVPRAMSVYVAGTVFGGFVGRVSGGLLGGRVGWRPVFVLLGVLGLCGAAATQWLLRPATMRRVAKKAESIWTPVMRNLRSTRLLATFAIGFCMLFTLVSVFSYITFYLTEAPFLLSTDAISWLFSVYLFGLVATLIAGTVLAKVGLRAGMLAAVGCCLVGVGLTLIHLLPVVALGLAVASSGVFVAQVCANSFLRDAAPAGGRVSAAGMYICSYYIGGTVGGVLPGLVWRMAGWPGCAGLTCGFLVIAGVTAFFGWREKNGWAEPVPV
ncbi:MFS transporter [Granulicella tundricola]|uniref:MFS transporter n=1 Tax=Granulicella tundricola TaxID=940615 RepID=UPI0018DB96F3|nr:MFS transporter [Granulicella tundricola]